MIAFKAWKSTTGGKTKNSLIQGTIVRDRLCVRHNFAFIWVNVSHVSNPNATRLMHYIFAITLHVKQILDGNMLVACFNKPEAVN